MILRRCFVTSTAQDLRDYALTSVIIVTERNRIVIVGGGGTMGSSTALHLARRGYKNIRILDVFPIPSANSAGHDLNKIAGTGGGRPGVWGDVTAASVNGWLTDELFKPHLHRTGLVDAAHNSPERLEELKATYRNLVEAGEAVEWLETEADIVRRAPHLKGANIKGWKGLWNGNAGWVAARDALDSVGHELLRLGVKCTFGQSGTFKAPLLSDDGTTCIGVIAEDGTKWLADRVVLATGAWSPTLVDLKDQCVSKCWVYAHIQLTPEEAEALKNIPVIYHHQLGFFIEPRPDSGLLKLCNEFPGYTRRISHTPFGAEEPSDISVPRSHAVHPSDTMPEESLDDIKRLVATLLPQLKDRKLINQAMCWCTDTDDANWLLCEDPRWKGLFLATGDSGHSFHTLPIVGGEVADLLEGKLSSEKMKAWAWRPGAGDPNGTGREGPPPKDLSEVLGWRHEEEEI
ncbi:hypothetical protein PLICRDRAFT_110680 [Plicaturopsis crispa FD-325 SS-3]|nr:hypothetical protein PLICRDRAFT_110680 [Plicaturopsis crispa FD-325 SS-3]